MSYRLNIGNQNNKTETAPLPIVEIGLRDGRKGTPQSRYLKWPHMKEYLGGYQCGFRERKQPEGYDIDQWMQDSIIAMLYPRYDCYIPPPQA